MQNDDIQDFHFLVVDGDQSEAKNKGKTNGFRLSPE